MAALSLQEIANIASRHDTTMSKAMLEACYARADAMGVSLLVPARTMVRFRAHIRRRDPFELTEDEWRRMMERNGDTRWNHC